MGSGYEIKEGVLTLRINPKVYPIERVFATAYVFLDKYYILLDGDKDTELLLQVRPKQNGNDLASFADRFFEELLCITNYFNQLEANKEMIQMILQRALFSLEPTPLTKDQEDSMEKILHDGE